MKRRSRGEIREKALSTLLLNDNYLWDRATMATNYLQFPIHIPLNKPSYLIYLTYLHNTRHANMIKTPIVKYIIIAVTLQDLNQALGCPTRALFLKSCGSLRYNIVLHTTTIQKFKVKLCKVPSPERVEICLSSLDTLSQ